MTEPLASIAVEPYDIETVTVERSRLPPWWLLAALAVAVFYLRKR